MFAPGGAAEECVPRGNAAPPPTAPRAVPLFLFLLLLPPELPPGASGCPAGAECRCLRLPLLRVPALLPGVPP